MTKSTKPTQYFQLKDLAKSQATNAKKIERLTIHYKDAYAGALSQVDYYLENAWNSTLNHYAIDTLYSETSTTRQKSRVINGGYYQAIIKLLEWYEIPTSYATAFYLANIDNINSMMNSDLEDLINN